MIPDILYEDNHIIVCVKPVHVLSQADSTNSLDMLSILKDYIKKKYNKPGNVFLALVHRLDKDVSGVMVFCKTSKAASRLSEQIRCHEVIKRYVLVCKGVLEKSSGTFRDLIKRDGYSSKVSPDGKEAVLDYKVISTKDNCSLVDVLLKTGRHHQIRVQFASRGYPILGDSRYSDTNKYSIALCSYSLSFKHPISKEVLTFKIDFPKDGYFKLFSDI